MNKISFVLFSLIISLSSFAYADKDKTIIAFGDSITVGVWENTGGIMYNGVQIGNGTRTGGYEVDLEQLTESVNDPHIVLNYGYSGEYTIEQPDRKGGYRRLREDILPFHSNASYIIIMEGTNDYWTGVSHNATVYMLRLMVQASKNAGITPILATLTPDTTESWGPAKNIPYYNLLIKNMAQEEDVILVDTYANMVDEWETKYAYAGYKGTWYPDMLHLNRTGYNKLAQLYFSKLSLSAGVISPTVNLLLGEE